jgi:predicted HD superfamily hydrolase involved in NAD metabolism
MQGQQELLGRIQRRVDALPLGLRDHIYRVRDIAKQLAPSHGIDPEVAALGMLAHDVARAMTDEELLGKAGALGLPIGTVEKTVPILLHGPVGAEMLAKEDGLADSSVHQAVYWHTTAHPDLDPLGKLVFLADKLDPQKIAAYPYQPYLKQLAMEDLDKAVLEFLSRETVSLVSRGLMVHPKAVETRNRLLS